MDSFIGFDSAWTDSAKAPGAICAVHVADRAVFVPPVLARFGQALDFVLRHASSDGVTLIGIDQPTVVPNETGSRPVDRVAASVMSWLGGAVQPAFRGRRGMFCDAAPIWSFLAALDAVEDPERARIADRGVFVMEVYPTLALATLHATSGQRRGGAKYNPVNRLFRPDDWIAVSQAAAREARSLSCEGMAAWCERCAALPHPRKADQDRLDAVLCALIAMRWRLGSRAASVLVGDTRTGYMVAPASSSVRIRLVAAVERLRAATGVCVAIDGQ